MSLLTRSTTSPAHAAPLVALLFLMGCDGAAPDTEGTGGNGGAAATSSSDSGSQGDAAAFSRLPPFDVLGVEWEYRYYFFEAAEYHTIACSVIDTFAWPDDTPGSAVRCSWDAEETADVTHGSIDAVKLEHYSENDGETSDVVELWWADDLGWVKLRTPTQEGELLWFEVP